MTQGGGSFRGRKERGVGLVGGGGLVVEWWQEGRAW